MILRIVSSIILITCLAACSAPPTAMTMTGHLEIIAPDRHFSVEDPPRDWLIDGPWGLDSKSVSIVDDDGIPALQLLPTNEPYRLVRRIEASLLATPYMAWSWVVNPDASGRLPMRLVVGFQGGSGREQGWGERLFASSLPEHDRIVEIGWGNSALKRGHLDIPSAKSKRPPFYVVRGGQEFSLSWKRETVDLARLYERLWPDDAMASVRIVFVGLIVDASREGALRLTGLTLSR